MGIRLTLGGEPLAPKPGQGVAWTMSYGISPNTMDLEITASSADRISLLAARTFATDVRTRNRADQVGPLDLVIEDTDNGRKVEIKGVYAVVRNRPGADYNTKVLTLADRRWLWDRTIVERSYNIRRKTGGFRLVRGNMQPVQVGRLRADFGYRRATLKGEGEDARPWTALEVIEDVLQELCGSDGYVIDSTLPLADSIEGLELHEAGPEALSRVLSFVPGAQVYVGTDGKVHLANLYDQSEEKVFKEFPLGVGSWTKVDKSMLRPQKFRVYSDREVELRFDFIEEPQPFDEIPGDSLRNRVVAEVGGISAAVAGQIAAGREPQWCENVIINPLFYLPLDPGGTKVATQGEAVPLDQFVDAVNFLNADILANLPFPLAAPRGFAPKFPGFQLTKREIRQHWLGNWPAFRAKFALDEQGLYNPERLRLLNAIRQHYRQTYRILPQWRDKIRSLRGDRAAILDFETGTRAPSPVFCQYLTKFSQLGYSPFQRGKMVTRNDDYAEDLSEKNVSPFEVEIIDSDLGLFRVVPKVDQTGTAETYMIGDTEDGQLPSADVANAAVFWHQVRLDRGFKLATIVTATQDTPNTEARLHEEPVTLQEAAELLKIEAPPATGPDMELLQTAETARYGWIDSEAEKIRGAFFDGKPYPRGLMVNPEEIESLSVAAAAQSLVVTLDRVEGRVTGPLYDVQPTGNLRSVVHFLAIGQGNQSAILTTINAPGDAPAPSVYSLLPEGVRRKVRRLIQQ